MSSFSAQVKLNRGLDFPSLDDVLVDMKLTPEVLELPCPAYFREERAKVLVLLLCYAAELTFFLLHITHCCFCGTQRTPCALTVAVLVCFNALPVHSPVNLYSSICISAAALGA